MSKNNSARMKFLASLVEDTFGVSYFDAQEIFTGYKYAELWENWMAGKGAAHIFVYYQKPGKFVPETGEWEQVKNGNKEFIVTEGDEKLKGKGVYFLRSVPPGKAISPAGTTDNEVLFGEVHENTVNTLNTVITAVYKPFIDKLTSDDWGSCELEAKKEFMNTFSRFALEVQEAIRSLNSSVTLDPYPSKYQKDAQDAINMKNPPNKNMVEEFENLFNQWYDKIEGNLDDTEADRKDDKDSGPKVELDFWKQKMRKLTGISEQLKSKNCRTVYDVLNIASGGNSADTGKPKEKLYLATSKWRSVELKVTEQLNEAKDNVKYLQTLEKFIEPLYEGNPDTIIETLPALMNSIKMIHTIARYYNTTERMTGLFVKITNMMIHNCKYNIINFRKIRLGVKPDGVMGGGSVAGRKAAPLDDIAIWNSEEYPPDELIQMLGSCIKLFEAYKFNYEKTKNRLKEMTKAKQFDFSEQAIFNKFELFCRRVGKLMELFGTIKQFKALEKHNLEGIEPIVTRFDKTVFEFKKKGHKLLDFLNGLFDKDYVEFNVEVSNVEKDLQNYIDRNFDHITNIEDSLKLLRKFRYILERPTLQKNLYLKYDVLLNKFSQILQKIESQYTNLNKNPPIVRNLPTVSGCITWSRHLFHRASMPLEHFPKDLLRQENRKPIKQVLTHNRIAFTLFSYEYVWRQKWSFEVDKAKAGLLATLIIRHPENNKLYVNFDSEILTLIREAKCLSRIGIDIPNQAKIVLLQEDKFKMYKNELQFVIREYDRIVNKIRPNTKTLLCPHLEDLEYKLRPGMVNLTWTSMNIDGYLNHVHLGLAKLEQLIININDIMENRIENNLKTLSKTVLVHLPQEAQTYSLDEFVEMQESWIHEESQKLKSKNYEVEGAVEDLIHTICWYQLDQHVEPISQDEIEKLNRYYNWSMYQALLHATKFSLNQMKERICGRRNAPKQILKPFFEVDVHLEGSKSILKPSLEEVQSAINRAASHVLKSTKQVQNWNQKEIPEDKREPFYDWIAKDKEIVKVILLLTGSIQGTKNKVTEFLEKFSLYKWLWVEKPEDSLKKFKAKEPQLEDFEAKLHEFDSFIADIKLIDDSHQIGALSLKTKNVKQSLIKQINNWKEVFQMELHKKAKIALDGLFEEIKHISIKIDKPVDDVDTLGGVMQALEEIRKKQSDIKLQFKPIMDMYALLDSQNQENQLDKEEQDKIKKLQGDWDKLVINAEIARNKIHVQQADFKKKLIENIGNFIVDVDQFYDNFNESGPNDPKIAKDPKEAVNRLKMFTEEFQVRRRKFDSYFAGETLFGLPHMQYENLDKIDNEIKRLDKLYGLYTRVNTILGQWDEIPWTSIKEEINNMSDQIEVFSKDCLRLPPALKDKQAYNDLKKSISDMQEVLPLVQSLAKESIRDRHWLEIIQLSGKQIPFQSETFILKDIFQANLLEIRDDVEDITDSAEKQLRLEKQLKGEITKFWEDCELQVTSISGRDDPCIIGGTIAEISEKIEEHLMALAQMNAMRYVKPFQEEVTQKIQMLSEAGDIIERWLKVQVSWQNLVSVFTSGDIAKQMPQESKIFKNIDKQWLKIMERAAEQKNVIVCVQNDILKTQLPELYSGLELCSKKLEAYLEGKRSIFPRFYFCSASDLLSILSNGSDPNAVQDDFAKLFDAINRVSFDEYHRQLIKNIHMQFGGTEEDMPFIEAVLAEGNIEDWLGRVEKEMQRSVKSRCLAGANDCLNMGFREFVKEYQSQIALLGIQILWTTKVTEALERPKLADKNAEFAKKKNDIDKIMKELTGMCLEDIPTKLERTKIETLVTIHVHQVGLFQKILDEVKKGGIKEISDFEWQKNTRVYVDLEKNDIKISVTDVSFYYQHEFLGVKERLCVTPLTDRCYITLSQALGMNFGGAPAGPAGTGKTETVKDLGRTLGIYVIVTNCSPEHKMIDMAKIFKGLCMSGLWGCFDEFNRISLPTLSVVAAQIEAMTTAKKRKMKEFYFPGEDKPIRMIAACGYFITMNPGYAGRQALPENLKVLFRGVTMMLPDRRVIIKVKLASVGYAEYEPLSYKFNILYKLSEEQLSAQRHYDFGLRNILSVLRTAGMVKRDELPGTPEEFLMARTLNDMNMSKFVFEDKGLFSELIGDIFTNLKDQIKAKIYPAVEKEINREMNEQNLEMKPSFFTKLIQLYETSRVRHGFMVVGAAGCGKTTIYNVLTKALSTVPGEPQYEIHRLNPKSITGRQMYGCMNNVGEWEEGIFSNIWKRKNAKSEKKFNWIQADGPVDAIWIENLNTVLDDNKILTLANAERIPMSDLCKMTFEVENLNNASPATVSRCGIIYVSANELGWEPLVSTWALDKQKEKSAQTGQSWKFMITMDKDKDSSGTNWNWCSKYVNKYLKNPKRDTFTWIAKNLVYKMGTPEVVRITMLLNLLHAVLEEFTYANVEPLKEIQFEKIFVYALAWAMAGLCEAKERQLFHKEILEFMKAPLPNIAPPKAGSEIETVFDYWFNPEKRDWQLWEAQKWEQPKKLNFSQLLIPTTDSTRGDYILRKIAAMPEKRSEIRKENGIQSSLVIGGPGTAKTSLIIMYSFKMGEKEGFKRINFSNATTPFNFQESIDGELEKRQSRVFQPIGGKFMTVFIDDFSMPAVNTWGDQETLEITRQLMDQKGLYFLEKDERGQFKNIQQIKFLAAMNHPGGGFNDVPNRIKRQFFSFNMTEPSDRAVDNIYGQILGVILVKKYYSAEVIDMIGPIIEATIATWRATSGKLLKTPSKFHYSFNIRELSRVFQGICRVAQNYEFKVIQNGTKRKDKPSSNLFMVGLWRHECKRTFYDKLVNQVDKKAFETILDKVTRDKFKDVPFKDPNFEEDMLITDYLFADFQRDDVYNEAGEIEGDAPFVYEACPDLIAIRQRALEKLEFYNEKNPSKKMNLVLFDDALSHLLRITRIINSPSGNALLVGVGGSGKQSLTKLASSICKQVFFQISLTKSYGLKDLFENIKALYETCGPAGKSATFILTDSEIKSETFLEAINSMLATGEIPGLLTKEDRDLFPVTIKTVFVKEGAGKKGEDPPASVLWNYFLNRVKDNLHTVLCFSPVGTKFRERSQKFPSLFSQCSIDWFLPWPLDALVDVSSKFIGDFEVVCTKDVKLALITHMGAVHNMVTEVCGIYFQQMRRNVYVTPKSYLAFLQSYQKLYKTKLEALEKEEKAITDGLLKLEEAGAGVNQMKKELAVKDENLKKSTDEVNALLQVLNKENEKADAKAREVNGITEKCMKQRDEIEKEKEIADKELKVAMPFLEKAKKAADSIDPKDIAEIKANRNPKDIVKLIFDAVQLLFQGPLVTITAKTIEIKKTPIPFMEDSYNDYAVKLMTADFCQRLMTFSSNERDNINEETVELMEPYLMLTMPATGEMLFTPEVANNTSKALGGLTTWCAAMSDYHKQSKIVKPKMKALEIASASLEEAQMKLAQAEQQLAEVKALQARLKGQFDEAQGKKEALAADAAATRKKMDQASRLISSLGDNRVRWEENSRQFLQQKTELVGNVAKACAFVSYCGPFNSDFRNKLTVDYFQNDLEKKGIPAKQRLVLTEFLVSQSQVGDWAMEGLPSDDLSIQNAIMVTSSDRFPLMIDPQGQARKWIIKREKEFADPKLIITLSHPNLKEAIKFPLQEGYPLLIENIEEIVDPMLDPLLEKQIIRKGRNTMLIKISETEMDYDPKFKLYMTSRLANPHFSPELAAKTTIIDFTVTQGGLEQQLLGTLIGKIEKSLEEQLTELQESVTLNKKELVEGEAMLLNKLATAQGSLLDDPTLIDVLAEIKSKSKEVVDKLLGAEVKTNEINEKREKYRPVAARGSVLYFCIVEMTLVNWMYNTSLYQFLDLFHYGIDRAPKAPRVEDRVENIIQTLTYKVYRYINRGLFEADKITFKVMMCLKIMIKRQDISTADVNLLLKAGSAIDDRNKSFSWMEQKTWLNLLALSRHKFEGEHQPFFKEIIERIKRMEKEWKAFFEKSETENEPVPDFQDKLHANTQIGHFLHLCLIRSIREDRTVLASREFIKKVLGNDFVVPTNDKIEELYEESTPSKPVLYLLQAGADPTQTVDEFALKKKKPNINKVSMGEAQEIPAKEKLKEGHLTGKWLLLSNCQLSLDLMSEMEELLQPPDKVPHPEFRLWITCDADNNFPLGLLQLAIKNTFVPPKGLQAGLSRTFNTQINPDFLERVEPLDKWRNVVFTVCFMHSVVLERRKYGPLGFTVPYEYNYGDMESSLLFIEKHMNFCFQNQVKEQWKAIRYITCEVQYGGRITDDLDREMFNCYGDLWLTEECFSANYQFNSLFTEFNYCVPDVSEHPKYLEYVNSMPVQDSPIVFGLNTLADLTFRLNESQQLISTLIDTQPKESGGAGGLSREDEVKLRIEKDFSPNLPANFDPIDTAACIAKFKTPSRMDANKNIPLTVFLKQEIAQFQKILDIVRTMMNDMVKAIDGEVVMTPDLVVAINNMYDFRVPGPWMYDATGVEISWISPSLGMWLQGLQNRYRQLKNWVEKDRPQSFWLTGFMRPQGFLTAVKQEVTRQHASEKWSLDEVDYSTSVQKEVVTSEDGSIEGKVLKPPSEGVLIHGLFLEGAGWNKSGQHIEESQGKDLKDLYFQFPVIQVTAESTRAPENERAAQNQKGKETRAQLEKTSYFCPVYKYKARTDKYLIFRVFLKPEGAQAPLMSTAVKSSKINWKLKGVALLCSKD